ncbi:phage holin family protein [bacterium]|nr:phage holin family protein [bacterium]
MKKSSRKSPGIMKEVSQALKLIWNGLLEGLQFRCELFGVELREVTHRYIFLMLLASIALFSLFAAFLCLNIFLLIVFWESRTAVSLGLFSFYFVVATALGVYVLRKVRSGPPAFSATIAVLKQDQALLAADN